MRKSRGNAYLKPQDISVLGISRQLLGAHGPLGDADLVGRLGRFGISPSVARDSLVRLEHGRFLAFGGHGWHEHATPPTTFGFHPW